MKFQALRPGQHTAVSINGKIFQIGPDGTIDVEEPRDIAKLTLLKSEWTPNVSAVRAKLEVAAVPPGEKRLGTAAEFLPAFCADAALRQRLRRIKSPAVRDSLILTLGYRFTEEQLAAASSVYFADHPDVARQLRAEEEAETVPGRAQAVPLPAGTVATDPPPPPESLWREPNLEKGEEWPDPTGDMPMPFLRKMAAAYRLKYPRNATKKELAASLLAAMYPETEKSE